MWNDVLAEHSGEEWRGTDRQWVVSLDGESEDGSSWLLFSGSFDVLHELRTPFPWKEDQIFTKASVGLLSHRVASDHLITSLALFC